MTTATSLGRAWRRKRRTVLSLTPACAITGARTSGSVLTVDPGAAGPRSTSISYQWLRAGAPIPGEVAATFTQTDIDVALPISCAVVFVIDGATCPIIVRAT